MRREVEELRGVLEDGAGVEGGGGVVGWSWKVRAREGLADVERRT